MTATTDVLGPVELPTPAGPRTPTCIACGQAHGILVPTGHGTWVHVNPDRCHP